MKTLTLSLSLALVLSGFTVSDSVVAKPKKRGVGCEQLSLESLQKRSQNYDKIIRKISRKHGVNPNLVKSVITVESCFRPKARGSFGEKGLMQLMPATARRFGVRNGYNVYQNIDGGTRYLKFLMKRYNGNERLALAAYNGGEGRVRNRVPKHKGIQRYVRKTMTAFNKFNHPAQYRKKAAMKVSSKTNKKTSIEKTDQYYVVRKGDTLYRVMRKTGVSVDAIRMSNKLGQQGTITVGQRLVLDKKKTSAKVTKRAVVPTKAEHYTVKSGDTLLKISRNTGISLNALQAANKLGSSQLIVPEQVLRLPTTKSSAAKTEKKIIKAIYKKATYTVKKGDTLFSIMKKTDVGVDKLRHLNALNDQYGIEVGQTLTLR